MYFRSWRWAVNAVMILVLSGISSTALGRDVTFFVVADLHYGQDQAPSNEQPNKDVIALMNNLPGVALPIADFGNVASPRGVLAAGDLTDSGTTINFTGYGGPLHLYDGFVDDYSVKGGTGVHLHFPAYEGCGNHDVQKQSIVVIDGIVGRNKQRGTPANVSGDGLHYSWDWDDVHFVNLNLYAGGPGDARDSLGFLQIDLADRVGASKRPIIIMQHYGFDNFSIYNDGHPPWWTQAERDAFYNVIKNYNVKAIFTGHEHRCERIYWNGIPDFVAPRAKGDKGTDGIYVVRLLDDKMIVAQRRLNGTWGNVWTEALTPPEPTRHTLMITAGVCILLFLLLVLRRRRVVNAPEPGKPIVSG